MKSITVISFLVSLFFAFGCREKHRTYKVLGNIEDPQNEIAELISAIVNRNLKDSIAVKRGIGSLANLDSLEAGNADFGIVDNYSRFSDKVTSIIPLYPQVLHVLVRKDMNPTSLRSLFNSGKVFPGIEGSGTKRFVNQLTLDLGINSSEVQFIDVDHFFDADVIFAFTDLLTLAELRDLKDQYKLFSLGEVGELGQGTPADAICTRHPQFEPFVISRDLYGSLTDKTVLTVKVDAVLVCRANLERSFIYEVINVLHENKQDLKDVNPLLFNVSADFDPSRLNFMLHPGAKDFLERYQPNFFEKNADLLSVIFSVTVALISSMYTIAKWRTAKKKNEIDKYYKALMRIRNELHTLTSKEHCKRIERELIVVQERAMDLLLDEKLFADESFSIFLNLSNIIMDEIRQRSLAESSPV
jgi:TRAP-type uncharacterized transport system substrate-binding protein